ncbi:putative glutathione S-transferase [Fusarium fujikuroi]|nr:putative glutathione S-transferase [Fusarium fujikuroi]KLP05049.1 putative glutathione S-transferase [Fusarium fujikuroi]
MASRPLITLFDIPSITRKSWSPNVWKARLVLNYKALLYTTEWLDFSNLSTYMQPHVKPNEPPLSPHTIPCILLQEGETTRGIMGSRSIAEELEKYFSSPSLQFDSEESAMVEELAEKLLISSRPLWAHLLPKNVLVPSDRQYYADTRSKRFGMSLDLYYSEHVSQQLWYQLDAICHEIGGALAETPGPFLMNYHPVLIGPCQITSTMLNPSFSSCMRHATSGSNVIID